MISCRLLPQYIIKPAHSRGSTFRWHRDSDWCSAGLAQRHRYLSLWVALDDMSAGNGALWVVPGSHTAPWPTPESGRQDVEQQRDGGAAHGDKGCTAGCGDDAAQPACDDDAYEPAAAGAPAAASAPAQQQIPHSQAAAAGGAAGMPAGAVPLYVKAGTAVVMTDTLLHGSGPNLSRHDRRAWMPQFSAGPLLWRDTAAPVAFAAKYE